MYASVQRDARTNSSESPSPGTARLKLLRDPVAEPDLLVRRNVFQGCGQPHHLVQSFRLNPFEFRQIFSRGRTQPPLQVRLQIIPNFQMAVFTQSARNPAPHDPKLDPDRLLLVKLHTLLEKGGGLVGPPLIERISKSRAQRIAHKLMPHTLVIGGTPAFSSAGVKRSPQFTQDRHAPLLAWSEGLFKPAPQLLHVSGNWCSRGWLAAKDALDGRARLGKPRRHRFDDRRCQTWIRAPQFKLEPPLLVRLIRYAPELQSPNLGQCGAQMNGNLSHLVFCAFEDGVNRR